MNSLLLLILGCGDKDEAAETGDPGDTAADVDADGDGYGAAEDCDDTNNAISPDADELCDGVDNDCDGRVDDGLTDPYFTDSDGDGFGAYGEVLYACEDPGSGYALDSGDCDDSDAEVYPGAEEICDDIDNDCGGVVDDDLRTLYYLDSDGDGFGDPSEVTDACEPPDKDHVEDGTDCDDENGEIHPDAEEICDGVDNNCAEDFSEASWAGLTGSTADLTTDFSAGTAEAPVELELLEPGVLTLCDGTAHVPISVGADVQIIGSYGAEATALSGGGQGTVVSVFNSANLTIEGVSVVGGAADMGAGLYVDDGAALTVSDVILAENIATTAGGALFVSTDASAAGTAVSFEDNEPDDISRGKKGSYTADEKGGFSCAVDSEVCK